MKHTGLLYLVVLVALLFWTSSEAPVSLSAPGFPKQLYEAPSECGFDGNPDFYGLGIRLGIYLQWISSFLANTLFKDVIAGTLETNFIFLLAVFIALADSTKARTIQSAEVIVLLHLCFGFILSILTVWGHRTKSNHTNETPTRSLAGSFTRLGLIATISAYSIWFWFRGIEILASPPCPAYTFIFSMQDARGPLHIFYQVQSCIVLGVYGILFIREFSLLLCFWLSTVLGCGFIAGLSVWLSMRSSQKSVPLDEDPKSQTRQRMISAFLKRWMAASSITFWSDANSGLSSGSFRPSLFWTYVFVDLFIFISRSTVQILCLVLFRRSPPIGFPSLLSVIKYRKDIVKQASKKQETTTQWSCFPVKTTPSYWVT